MRGIKRALIGRTIVGVDFRPFSRDIFDQRAKAHDPVLTLDNGRRVYFVTEETEVGEYGTSIQITSGKRKEKR